jgi:four helix bundle protein
MVSYFSIALRSANETKYWLCLVRDTLEVNKAEVNELVKEADELSKILAKSILTLKQNHEV